MQSGVPTLSHRILRASAPLLLCGLATVALPAQSSAQVGAPTSPGANPYTVKMFHPTPPLLSYEVASIRRADPTARQSTTTIKNYILTAYGASRFSQEQVVGGPAWVATSTYVIQAKVPDELRAAMPNMTRQQRDDRTHAMQQSLLADRFQLKAHFEVRQLPVLELTIAKAGLKVKPLHPPPAPAAGDGPPKPADDSPSPGVSLDIGPGARGGPGAVEKIILSGKATTVAAIVNVLRTAPGIDGRPILDKTGFTGHFDVTGMEWSGLTGDDDAPSLFAALDEKLGLKLTETKGPVEVLVIDSIERPSEN